MVEASDRADVDPGGGGDTMPVKLETKIDMRKFNTALAKARQRQMEQIVRRGIARGAKQRMRIGARVEPMSFVEMGTLRPSWKRRPLFNQMGRSVTDDLAQGIKRMSWAQAEYLTRCQLDSVYNIARRHLWLRMALLLTLVIIAVAILCQ